MTDRVPLVEVQDQSDNRTPEQKDSDNAAAQMEKLDATLEPQSFMDDLSYHKAAKFFDLSYEEMNNSDVASQINTLRNWASAQTDSDDIVDVINEIATLKKFLGMKVEGIALIKKMYQWARLDMDRKRLVKEMRSVHASGS